MIDRLSSRTWVAILGWLTTLAASLAFGPLLEGRSYVVTAAALTAAPLLVGIALRAVRTPAVLVFAGQLVALLLWANVMFAQAVLPTRESIVRLADLLQAGVESSKAQPPPAELNPGLMLLVAAGIAASFCLVDLFAATLGRVPLTGLPLLALHTVPSAVSPQGVPTIAFVLTAVGFAALLASDERSRLGQWGRHLAETYGGSRGDRDSLAASALNSSARRVGVLAIGLAAIVPLLVPPVGQGLIGTDGLTAGSGQGTISVANPMVDLRRRMIEQSDEPAMQIRTQGPAPEYFRLVALDQFDGRRWHFSDRRLDANLSLDGPLSAPPGLDSDVATRTQRFSVQVSDSFHSDWLPAPYAPGQVRIDGDWRYNPETLDIIVGHEDLDTSGVNYQVTSRITEPTAQELMSSSGTPARITSIYNELPDDFPKEIEDLADQIVGPTASRYQKAVRLQRFFRESGGFTYTLNAPAGDGDNDLVDFLLHDRRGYCQQFSAAMAVMARYEGIPARVAVGFLWPERISSSGVYQYTYADLHAWPELYFEGVGWVRFEPTPSARTGAPPGYTSGQVQNQPEEPTTGPTDLPSPTAQQTQAPLEEGAAAAGGDNDDSGGPWGTVGIALAAAALLLLITPMLVRSGLRRRRRGRAGDDAERAENAWLELRDTVWDLRQQWPLTTPRRTVQVLEPRLRHRPDAVAALGRLSLAVERARYARTTGDTSKLWDDLATVRDALLEKEARTDRVRAVLFPRSLRKGYRSWRAGRPLRSQTRDDDASALPSAT